MVSLGPLLDASGPFLSPSWGVLRHGGGILEASRSDFNIPSSFLSETCYLDCFVASTLIDVGSIFEALKRIKD